MVSGIFWVKTIAEFPVVARIVTGHAAGIMSTGRLKTH